MKRSSAEISSHRAYKYHLDTSYIRQYGQLLHGPDLLEVLGYSSTAALRKAIQSKRIGLKLFPVPGRRGPFVLTVDAAHWLLSLRDAAYNGELASEASDRQEKRPMS